MIIYTDERAEQLIKQGGLLLDPITNALRKLLSGFARIINKKYNRSGSLFRQKTKTKLLSEDNVLLDVTKNVDYCANCFVYVHQNPLNAGIVSKLENWEYSSFKDFAGLRNGTLCNKEIAAKFCSYKSEDFMKSCYEEVIVDFENHF
ncbi:MAG: hypothetical protein EOP53_14260 [Sphingobacteriales bacterium]|nr:MAG: hypothetical protein EOP53_14260 [Sphingobacteriales bacterium]